MNYEQTFDDMLEKAWQTTVQARKAAEDAARRFGLEDVVRRHETELTNPGRVEPSRNTLARTDLPLPVSTAHDNAAAEVTATAAGRTQGDRTARGVSGHSGTDLPTRRDFEATREMPGRTQSDLTMGDRTATANGRTASDRTTLGVSGHSGADLPPARLDLEATGGYPSRTTLREKVARAAAEHGLSRELSALSKVDYDEVTGALETLTRDVRNMDPRKALKTAMASPAAKTAKKFLGPAGVLLSAAVIGDILSDMGDAAAEGNIDALGTGAGDLADQLNPVPGISLSEVGQRHAKRYGKSVEPGVRAQQLTAEAAADRAVASIAKKRAAADRQEVEEDINVLARDELDFKDLPVTVAPPTAKTPAAKKGQSGLLALGARGRAVAGLQAELQKLGLLTGSIISPGTFDTQTKQAVQRLQSQQGIATDGMYGSDTVKALEAAQVAAEPEWVRRARAKHAYLNEKQELTKAIHAPKKD